MSFYLRTQTDNATGCLYVFLKAPKEIFTLNNYKKRSVMRLNPCITCQCQIYDSDDLPSNTHSWPHGCHRETNLIPSCVAPMLSLINTASYGSIPLYHSLPRLLMEKLYHVWIFNDFVPHIALPISHRNALYMFKNNYHISLLNGTKLTWLSDSAWEVKFTVFWWGETWSMLC